MRQTRWILPVVIKGIIGKYRGGRECQRHQSRPGAELEGTHLVVWLRLESVGLVDVRITRQASKHYLRINDALCLGPEGDSPLSGKYYD
jgi:hypothetical protein